MADKSVPSSAPGATNRHLDMNAARAATQAGPVGQSSDVDDDDGASMGGSTDNADGSQPPSNGVNAGASPASLANRVRPGGGITP